MYITSRIIELESPGCLGFIVSNPEQQGLSSSIRLEVVCIYMNAALLRISLISTFIRLVTGRLVLSYVQNELSWKVAIAQVLKQI